MNYQTYSWDIRKKEDVRKCFAEGKHNGLLAIQAIMRYCLTKTLGVLMNDFALVNYVDNSKKEVFEEDGQLTEYDYDYMLTIAKGKQIYECPAEMKTTTAILSNYIYIKKSQVDNLMKKYDLSVVIISDPEKFIMMNTKKFVQNSIIQKEPLLGNKEVYFYKPEKIIWNKYQFREPFLKLRNISVI